jgi:NADH-quinone oxidoreductase subunit G/NADP-reducing hydrogenase subunit HndD
MPHATHSTQDKKNQITINDQVYSAQPGQSVLEVALAHDIDIPHVCFHHDLPVDANCRTCLVQVESEHKLQGKVTTACTLKAEPGLAVATNSPQVEALRKRNLELLLAGYPDLCSPCHQKYGGQVQKLIKRYDLDPSQYQPSPVEAETHQLGSAAEIDPQACVACNKCVEICRKIGIGYLQLEGKGAKTHVTYNKDPKVACIYCGQCTAHCPVGAAREQCHLEPVEEALADPEQITIAQMAPSVRASIGECFNQPYGKDLSPQMFTAFRQLGFDYVFDVNMGADITTMVEAQELIERLTGESNKPLPMFTSCCPAWVKFIEFYYPDMLEHLTTSRSPQIHCGAAYKTWWAEKQGLDPKKIRVISFMPCTSKKYEAQHDKLKIDDLYPVDYVLTTRETEGLLRKHQIDLPQLKPGKVDTAGTYSGAGAIYGASGGVMESALRTAAYLLSGKQLPKLEFEQVRGIKGLKKTHVTIAGQELKIAVVSTPKNARVVLSEIKRDADSYDYVEFMACPGGCIGGGGQPLPNTEEIVKQRIAGLYQIDDKMKLRQAHNNPVAKEFLDYVAQQSEHRQHQLLHTEYRQRGKFE